MPSAIRTGFGRIIQRSELRKKKYADKAIAEKKMVAFAIGEQFFIAQPSGVISGPFKKMPQFAAEPPKVEKKVEEPKTQEPEIMRCGYCLTGTENLKLCYLRIGAKEWEDKSKLICAPCRKHLNGKYKFDRRGYENPTSPDTGAKSNAGSTSTKKSPRTKERGARKNICKRK